MPATKIVLTRSAIVAVLLLPLPAEAGHAVPSPPHVIRYHPLAFTVPMGWKVVPQDLPFRLYGRSYDFDLVPSSPVTRQQCAAITRNKVVHLELLNDTTGMVRVKGGLVGRPYTTIHRIHGLLDDDMSRRDDTHHWSFYILNRPSRRTDNTITIRVSGLSGSPRSQERFVKSLINSARMVREMM